MDAAYKFDLKDMNELNFARFDAKLDQRVAELRADLGKLEARIDAKLDQRVTELRVDLVKLEARIDLSAAQLRESLEKGLRDQMRFFFLAWATLLGGMIALWFR